VAVVAANAPALHLLGYRRIVQFDAPSSGPYPAVAVFLSGDMGFGFGLGGPVASAVAAHGIPVFGVSTPVAFARHRSAAEARALVASAIRQALNQTGARHVVLMGQSFGADIVATVAPELPPALRRRIVAIDLIVPGQNVYFRADPTGLAYMGAPDARPAKALRALDWAPVICIQGKRETDSLCPTLKGTRARLLALPGNHYLERNAPRLIAANLASLHAVAGDPIGSNRPT
jgi:type IV secretory pathway VirJ component